VWWGVSEHISTSGMFCLGIFLKIYGCQISVVKFVGLSCVQAVVISQ